MTKYSKKQAVSIIINCASMYEQNLNKHKLLFILKDKSSNISSLEVAFYPYNFLHLTGIKLKNTISAMDFYKRCLKHKLSPNDFEFSSDGTTYLKLEILPLLLSKNISAKMIGDFNTTKPKLYTEKLVGNVKGCFGFIKTAKSEYIPNTVLNTDIRNISNYTAQVIATYRRSQSTPLYNELVYKNNNIDWNKVILPSEYVYFRTT